MKLVHAAYEPGGAGPHPTIIAMHGWGSNALDLIGLAPYIAAGRFLVLCPQGPLDVSIGAVNGYGWYQLRPGSPPDEAAMAEAVGRMTAFIDAAATRYPIDTKRLVILGFSQGGVMAYNIAMRDPARFAALVALSTWFPDGLAELTNDRAALERMPTLVQHGRADDAIEIGRARKSVERIRALDIPVVYHEYDCGHEITVDMLEDLSKFLNEKVPSSGAQ